MSNLNNAYKYILSKLNTAIIIEKELRHKSKLELPEEALREAIINAMIHKDYNVNSPVQINISPDKVEIINPGKLLFPEKELGKRSVLRNPILVDLVHRLGLVEKAGSGIKRIQRLVKQENVRVKFETGMFFEVIFYRKIRSKSEANPTQIRHKSDANRTQIGRKPDAKIREKWILNYLKKHSIIKTVDIVKQFNIVKDTASRDLKSLIKQDKIEKKGGGNNVWYELKNKVDENGN